MLQKQGHSWPGSKQVLTAVKIELWIPPVRYRCPAAFCPYRAAKQCSAAAGELSWLDYTQKYNSLHKLVMQNMLRE